MPFRETGSLRDYELRSVRTIYVATAMMALGCVGTLVLMFFASYMEQPTLPLGAVLLGLMLGTASYVASIKNHVVFGGRAALRLYPNRLEVPRPFSRQPLVLEFDALEVSVEAYEGRFAFRTVSSVEVLRMRQGDATRELSSRMFGSLAKLREAARDITALKAGEALPPESVVEPTPDPAPVRDAYDDALDRELAELD